MKRTGRAIIIFILIIGCIFGLWFYGSYRGKKIQETGQTISNVYITSVSGSTVQFLSGDKMFSYDTASVLTGSAIAGVADIRLQREKITKIYQKPEEIQGKLLKIHNQSLTIEGYGEVPLDDNFVVYQRREDGSVSDAAVSALLVGDEKLHFVAAGGKICAVVMSYEESQNIRVLLKDYEKDTYDMESVTVTSDQNYQVLIKDERTDHAKGEEVTFTAQNTDDRIQVIPENGGKIAVINLKRSQGIPYYRGKLEIDRQEDALHVINEVPLEEYLYSVVPSEMPSEYSEEALKTQAICARTYAISQMKNQRLAQMGAHVDDSVSYQVYNNLKEDEKTIKAVDETRGKVVTYKNEPVSTYFYSTSCGSSEGTKDVWYTKEDAEYLPSQYLTIPRQECNLKSEEEFKKFIQNPPDTVDRSSSWYRWKATISKDTIQKSIENKIAERIKANATQIQIKDSDGNFHAGKIESIGSIQAIRIKERGTGGVVSMMEVEGSENTIRIYTEYNIRMLLGDETIRYLRGDKKEVSGLGILPSGYFYIKEKDDSFVIRGGGYGHGVGMSQTGANELAKRGKTAEEIIAFYFPQTVVQERGAL